MIRFLGAAAVAAAALSAAAPRAAAFDRLVVFGDSLSDTGNAGRFSNGPVWVEGLARRLGLSAEASGAGGTNYAVGGARLDPASGPSSLPAQLLRHRGEDRDGGAESTLHVVYGGGNDLIAATYSGGEHAVDVALRALEAILADLVAGGATDVLVPNLPDVGMTPAARGQDPAALDRATRLTARFNAGLERVLAELEAAHPVRLSRLDVWAMGERARRDPAAFGFIDVTTPCVSRPTCDGYLFWDGIHPTSAAHERLAGAAAEALAGR